MIRAPGEQIEVLRVTDTTPDIDALPARPGGGVFFLFPLIGRPTPFAHLDGAHGTPAIAPRTTRGLVAGGLASHYNTLKRECEVVDQEEMP